MANTVRKHSTHKPLIKLRHTAASRRLQRLSYPGKAVGAAQRGEAVLGARASGADRFDDIQGG